MSLLDLFSYDFAAYVIRLHILKFNVDLFFVALSMYTNDDSFSVFTQCVTCHIKDQSIRVELESQMKVVTIDRNFISDNVVISAPTRDTSRYGMGSETPTHPSRTPLHPYMTPTRDPGATPMHDGMRTPMRDRARNPYAPMSPPRDKWEEGNLAS
ncbi:hypothetical protein Godav_009806 [Gossypium davidsonii]|uniref:Uncharacterized protein n=1 Tax=Gossypium davidsonii TaxID=34287 RepID=A0A7J8SEC7_GOSDV|nr:hypothetical protein [Gossypium davidsonii]